MPDAQQILARVRRHTRPRRQGRCVGPNYRRTGRSLRTPSAVLGLPPVRQREIALFSGTRVSRFTGSTRWSSTSREPRGSPCPRLGAQLSVLLSALDDGRMARRPPLVSSARMPSLCAGPTRLFRSIPRRPRMDECSPTARGCCLRPGLLEVPVPPIPLTGLPPVAFDADIKDASLVPLRDSLVSLVSQAPKVWARCRGSGRRCRYLAPSCLREPSPSAAPRRGPCRPSCSTATVLRMWKRDPLSTRRPRFNRWLRPSGTAPDFASDIRGLLLRKFAAGGCLGGRHPCLT